MTARHIGILTGGGDVPGLNSAIKSVYQSAKQRGWLRPGTADASVTGILRGWKGALQMGEDPAASAGIDTMALTDATVREVDRYGGTFLHTSRTRPDRMNVRDLPERLKAKAGELPRVGGAENVVDATDAVIRNLSGHRIDCLVAIGGDDTLGYAHTLHSRGFPVIGIPKTMDNDVRGTEYALGFATALTRSVEFINRQRTHLGSNEVVGVFRVFGRNAGFTSLGTAMAISDIRCAIPEHAFDLETLCRLVEADHREHESHYAMIVISEGAMWMGGQLQECGEPDGFGHRKKMNVGEQLAQEITRITNLPTRPQDLTYDLRSGDPDPLDRIVASTFGALAVELLAEGTTGRMLAIEKGNYTHSPLPDAKRGARTVDVASYYDTARFRPRFAAQLGKPIFF
ncbi:MAG TPA: 6-phosphofructokinase [Thermoanaerobaculia bacterium]|nr:6-phosphofructokinase [Thermoanaerobaculia bacterium]